MTLQEHQEPEIQEHLRELTLDVLEMARASKTFDQFGTAAYAKMWILPDVKIQPLNQWHWQWLQTNIGVADKFGIGEQVRQLKGADEQTGRIVALKAGFIRVNYERNSGRLTFEGCAKRWDKRVKDAVFMLVCDNADKIDHISTTLFNDTVTGVLKQGSATLLDYDDQEKLKHIPFLSDSARGKALIRVRESSMKASNISKASIQ